MLKKILVILAMLQISVSICEAQSPTYLWSNGATTASINVNPQVTTTYYVDITYNGTVYHDSAVVQVINALPAPTSIDGPSGGCPGQSNVVFSTPVVPGATQYNWTLPPGATGSSTTETISVTFSSSYVTGPISVGVSDGQCSSPLFTRNLVSYNAVPAVPGLISGPTTNVCSGTLHSFSVAPVTNATSYVWVVPAGCTVVSGAGTNSIQVSVPVGFVSGNLSVRASNCVGAGSARLLTIRGLPGTPGLINGPTTGVCQNSSAIYTISPVSSASSYVWSGPSGSNIMNQGSASTQIDFPSGFVSGNVSVQAQNGCGTGSARTLSVRSIPLTPASITGQVNNLCSNFPFQYTAGTVAGATNYIWTVPSGATFSNPTIQTASVTYPPVALSGNITVAAGNFCGSSSPRSLAVTTSPVTPTVISGPSAVCSQQSGVMFSVSPLNGASNIQWQVPSGASVSFGQGSPTAFIDFGSTAGFIRVQASNACGAGRVVQKAVSFNCRTGEEGATDETEQEESIIASEQGRALTVFPNPAENELFLQCGDNLIKANPAVSLMDVLGREVWIGRINSSNMVVDIGHLPDGLYFLRVQADGLPVVRIIKR